MEKSLNGSLHWRWGGSCVQYFWIDDSSVHTTHLCIFCIELIFLISSNAQRSELIGQQEYSPNGGRGPKNMIGGGPKNYRT